jgi:hypothetical protein
MRSGGTCCLPTPYGSFHLFCHSDREHALPKGRVCGSGGTCCLPTPYGSFHLFCHSDRSMPFRREGYAKWRNLLFTYTLRIIPRILSFRPEHALPKGRVCGVEEPAVYLHPEDRSRFFVIPTGACPSEGKGMRSGGTCCLPAPYGVHVFRAHFDRGVWIP